MSELNHPILTVVICTYNRAFILGECLTSLHKQSVDSTHFNLLIIDNNSTDSTQELLVEQAQYFAHYTVLIELEQGLSHARNRALLSAHSPWIAFLDDDAKAHTNWVETILATIHNDDFDIFGGSYYAWHRFGPPPRWFSPEWGTYVADQPYGILQAQFHIPGGNCALRRDMALQAGAYSANFGMTGGKCAYGEETALFNQMRLAGSRLGYVPNMKIDHCVVPHKYTLRWQFASSFAHGRDEMCVAGTIATWRKLCSCIYACAVSLCVDMPRSLILAPFKQNENWLNQIVVALRGLCYNIGRLAATGKILLQQK